LIYDISPFLIIGLLCLTLQLNIISADHIVFAKTDDRDSEEEDDDRDSEEEDDDRDSEEEDDDRDSEEEDDDRDSEEEDDDRDSEEEDDDRDSEEDNNFKSLSSPSDKVNSKYDKFEIEKIYPSKPGGEEWFMNMKNIFDDSQFYPFGVSDSKFEDPNLKIIKNEDGSWKLKSKDDIAKVRMNVYTSEGYQPKQIESLDHSELAENGYMQSEKDWKNVEITGYIKLNTNNIPLSEGRFTWYARGGHHTEGAPCEGVAYKGDIFFSGDTRFAKEQWHPNYVFTDIKKDLKPKENGLVINLYCTIQKINPSRQR
jgi:hypothetical protein